jgi:hypothetical protein
MSVQVKVEGVGYVTCTPHFGGYAIMRHPNSGSVKMVEASEGQVTSITVLIGGTEHEVWVNDDMAGDRLMSTMVVGERDFTYALKSFYGLADSEVELVRDDDQWCAFAD